MKIVQLFARDETGKPVLVSLTKEEIDAAQRQFISQSGKPFISGACLCCNRAAPSFGKSYCEPCGE